MPVLLLIELAVGRWVTLQGIYEMIGVTPHPRTVALRDVVTAGFPLLAAPLAWMVCLDGERFRRVVSRMQRHTVTRGLDTQEGRK